MRCLHRSGPTLFLEVLEQSRPAGARTLRRMSLTWVRTVTAETTAGGRSPLSTALTQKLEHLPLAAGERLVRPLFGALPAPRAVVRKLPDHGPRATAGARPPPFRTSRDVRQLRGSMSSEE